MVRTLGSLLLLAGLSLVSGAQTPVFGPAVAVGTYPSSGQSLVTSNALDAQGNVYVTGVYLGNIQVGNFNLSSYYGRCFVAKFDAGGVCRWVQEVESPLSSFGGGVVVDATGAVTITGEFTGATATFGAITLTNTSPQSSLGDVFVARLDPAGNWLWAVKAGGADRDGCGSLGLDAAGNSYVTGLFSSKTISFGNTTLTNADTGFSGTYDLFVAKLSPQGAWLWARSGGGSRSDESTALALDADANVYVTGRTQGPDATFGPHAVAGPASANEKVLVAKLDANGNWQWAVRAGGNLYEDAGWAIATDRAGNAYVTGRFSSPTATFGATTLTNTDGGSREKGDAFVAKITAAGQWQWATQARGSNDEYGSGIALDGAGRLAVVGTFASTTAQFGTTTLTNTAGGTMMPAPSSVFLAHLSPDGAWLGAASSQHGEGQRLPNVTADAWGNFSVAGSFQGSSFELGPTTLTGGTSGPSTGFVTLVPTRLVIASFAPGSGAPGQLVTIKGSGFVDVTQVLFGTAPAAFTVQSATQLTATVPTGVAPGLLSVHTATGTVSSPEIFMPLALATLAPAGAGFQLWPNPVRAASAWQVQLPATASTSFTRVEVRNLLGQLVLQTQFAGPRATLPALGLAAGSYQLTLVPTGQPAWQRRVEVTE